MRIVRRKKEARIDSDRFAGFERIAVGGGRGIRDNYKLVSCSVLSLVEFWIRPAWLAFRVSLRHGISAFLGKKRVADPQSRVKTRVPVLGRHVLRRDHTRGSLVSILSSLYVFLTSFDFCVLEIAPPSSRNRKRIDSGARMRSNIGNEKHDLFENFDCSRIFCIWKNLSYRIVLDHLS